MQPILEGHFTQRAKGRGTKSEFSEMTKGLLRAQSGLPSFKDMLTFPFRGRGPLCRRKSSKLVTNGIWIYTPCAQRIHMSTASSNLVFPALPK